ncbi:MAG: hypothetical protein E7523_11300 [Ruminococcaceae bacterium]|nr:hypothetical protein [Oscillospiraceae bacterium]
MKHPFAINSYMNSLFDSVYKDPFADAYDRDSAVAACDRIKHEAEAIFALDKIPGRLKNYKIECISETDRGCFVQQKLAVTYCENLTMPVYLLMPKKIKEKAPCTVALCGHGYGVRQILGTRKNGKPKLLPFFDEYQKQFAVKLAEKGCMVAAPELFGFGEMKLEKDFKIPFYSSSCKTVSSHFLPFGITTASMRILQAKVCADILLQQEKADANRLGIMGISGGGLTALYASVLDERFKRICIAGYVNSFKTSILNMWHCPDNYFPDVINTGDIADFACALAPRVLITESGKKDPLFPLDGTLPAIEKIRRVYSLLGAEHNYTADVFDGKHQVHGTQSFRILSE